MTHCHLQHCALESASCGRIRGKGEPASEPFLAQASGSGTPARIPTHAAYLKYMFVLAEHSFSFFFSVPESEWLVHQEPLCLSEQQPWLLCRSLISSLQSEQPCHESVSQPADEPSIGSERLTGPQPCPVDSWPGPQGAQFWTSPTRIVLACPAASHPVLAPLYLYALSTSRLDVKTRGEGDSLAHRVVQSV